MLHGQAEGRLEAGQSSAEIGTAISMSKRAISSRPLVFVVLSKNMLKAVGGHPERIDKSP